MKNAIILSLALIVGFLCYRIVVIENQRYALMLNMCPGQPPGTMPDLNCIKTTQTRTHWIWHLYYALDD